MITIVFKAGRNLAAKDSNNSSDPYIKVALPAVFPESKTETLKSQVVDKSLNPTWNFYTKCYVGVKLQDIPKLPPVKAEVWDKDLLVDDFMGQFDIPIAKLAESPKFESWIDVQPRNSKDTVSGQILVLVRYLQKTFSPDTIMKVKSAASLSPPSQKLLEDGINSLGGTIDSPKELDSLLPGWDSLFTFAIHRCSGLQYLEKKIAVEKSCKEDEEFRQFLSEDLFHLFDANRDQSIDWEELIYIYFKYFYIAVSIPSLEFLCFARENSTAMTKEEFQDWFRRQARSFVAASRVASIVAFKKENIEGTKDQQARQKAFDSIGYSEKLRQDIETKMNAEYFNHFSAIIFDSISENKRIRKDKWEEYHIKKAENETWKSIVDYHRRQIDVSERILKDRFNAAMENQ